MDIYLHGIETIESNNGPRPVETIDTGIIGLVFTAPDADAELWPLNKPVAVHGYSGYPGGLGNMRHRRGCIRRHLRPGQPGICRRSWVSASRGRQRRPQRWRTCSAIRS